MPGMNGEMPLLILRSLSGKTLIPVVRQLEQWENEFRPAMKKILGMEDGR